MLSFPLRLGAKKGRLPSSYTLIRQFSSKNKQTNK